MYPSAPNRNKRMIEPVTEPLAKKSRAPPRARLTPKEKEAVWERYYGNEFRPLCYCCNKRHITPWDYHGAHIIPDCEDGPVNEDNIIPICRDCNSTSGKRNLFEYQRNTYPKPNQLEAKRLLKEYTVEQLYELYVRTKAKQRKEGDAITFYCPCRYGTVFGSTHPIKGMCIIDKRTAYSILVEHLEHICI